jgi:hypothetical protein
MQSMPSFPVMIGGTSAPIVRRSGICLANDQLDAILDIVQQGRAATGQTHKKTKTKATAKTKTTRKMKETRKKDKKKGFLN